MLDVGQSDIVHAIQVLSAALQSGRLTLDGATMPVLLSIGAKPAKGQPEASAKAANARRQAEFRARRKALRVTEIVTPVTEPEALRNVTAPVTESNVTSNAEVTLLIDETTEKQAFREPLRNVTSNALAPVSLSLISEREEKEEERDARGVTRNVTESVTSRKASRVTKRNVTAALTEGPAEPEDEPAFIALHKMHGDADDLAAFFDVCRSKGLKYERWQAGFRTFIRNEIAWGKRPKPIETKPFVWPKEAAPPPKPPPTDAPGLELTMQDLVEKMTRKAATDAS